MKTLLLSNLDTGRTWLESDAGFSALFQHSEPHAVREVSTLAEGKELFFSVPASDSVMAPNVRFSVRRIAEKDRVTL